MQRKICPNLPKSVAVQTPWLLLWCWGSAVVAKLLQEFFCDFISEVFTGSQDQWDFDPWLNYSSGFGFSSSSREKGGKGGVLAIQVRLKRGLTTTSGVLLPSDRSWSGWGHRRHPNTPLADPSALQVPRAVLKSPCWSHTVNQYTREAAKRGRPCRFAVF